ncbi:hypothetical protein KR222_006292, partial [Zaprionus bogoriensis]
NMFEILRAPHADPVILPLVAGPEPMIVIVISYLLFLMLGPKLMESREAFQLRGVLKVYNLIQILFNSAMMIGFVCMCAKEKLYDIRCITVLPVDHKMKNLERAVCYGYYINKIMDLTDTVFFVLRKSHKQITMLHLIHHIYMVVANYTLIRIYGYGGHFVVTGFLNTIVHIVMYSYYYLSSQRPSIRENLWFKKYITVLQLVQFVLVFAHSAWTLMQPNCEVPRWSINLVFFMSVLMFAMFTNFYIKTYIRPRPQSVRSK